MAVTGSAVSHERLETFDRLDIVRIPAGRVGPAILCDHSVRALEHCAFGRCTRGKAGCTATVDCAADSSSHRRCDALAVERSGAEWSEVYYDMPTA